MIYYNKAKYNIYLGIISVLLLSVVIITTGCGGGKKTYGISGTITSGGSPLPNVMVTLAGSASMVTTTDAGGNYAFGDVPVGTFTVTPSLSGYTFSPPSRNVWLDGIDAVGFNFSASIQGRVAASMHSVYLKSDGTVLAWGNNSDGQLGDGTTAESHTPLQVKGVDGAGALSDVKAIGAGTDHTVALKNDGTVWVWGNNSNGQFGNNSTTGSKTPVQVSGLSDVTAVAAGYHYTVALKSDGTVWSWGYNNKGQLGDGTTNESHVPLQVKAVGGTGFLSPVKAIAAGYDHTVALMSDGTVCAWGNNIYGQLGNGTIIDSSTPVQASGLFGVIAIAAGYNHTVALKYEITAIKVWTWGNNDHGQLGNGITPYSMNPAVLGGLSNLTAVAAGKDHTVVLTSDGTLWAWGNNDRGQIGDGTTTERHGPVQVSRAGEAGLLSGVVAIAAGDGDTVVFRTDNTIWSWGNNNNGRLGNGDTTDRSFPFQIP
jgi:alpha-tubulin suppressor-like RCC1 family protein